MRFLPILIVVGSSLLPAAGFGGSNPFLGTKLTKPADVRGSKSTALPATLDALPVPPPGPTPNLATIAPTPLSPPLENVTSRWRAIGRIDSTITLESASGEIQLVQDGATVDGCVVHYPELLCGATAKAQAERARSTAATKAVSELRKSLDLKTAENAKLLDQIDRLQKAAETSTQPPADSGAASVSLPSWANRQFIKATHPTLGIIEYAREDSRIIFKLPEAARDSSRNLFGAAVLERIHVAGSIYLAVDSASLVVKEK